MWKTLIFPISSQNITLVTSVEDVWKKIEQLFLPETLVDKGGQKWKTSQNFVDNYWFYESYEWETVEIGKGGVLSFREKRKNQRKAVWRRNACGGVRWKKGARSV